MQIQKSGSAPSHNLTLSSLESPAELKKLCALLAEGTTVQMPITSLNAEQLRGLIGQQLLQIPNEDLHKLDKVVADTICIDPTISTDSSITGLQVDRHFYVGGLSLDKDTIKGGVVGGGVAGLVLSVTDITARGVGGYIGMFLSCIGLGAVIYPELAKKLRDSEVTVGPWVTLKPPSTRSQA